MANADHWKDKRVLITGVCGTVGRELLEQIRPYEPEHVVGLDNNESELFFLNEAYRNDGVGAVSAGRRA